MTTQLETYDSQWEEKYKQVQEQINAVICAPHEDKGIRSTAELTGDTLAGNRLRELNGQATQIELSQFETLEACLDHYTNILFDDALSVYAEHQKSGVFKDPLEASMSELVGHIKEQAGLSDAFNVGSELPGRIKADIALALKDGEIRTAQDVLDRTHELHQRLAELVEKSVNNMIADAKTAKTGARVVSIFDRPADSPGTPPTDLHL